MKQTINPNKFTSSVQSLNYKYQLLLILRVIIIHSRLSSNTILSCWLCPIADFQSYENLVNPTWINIDDSRLTRHRLYTHRFLLQMVDCYQVVVIICGRT